MRTGGETSVETTVARKRLEEMRADLDRSIAVLQGEGRGPVAAAGYPQDAADAGSLLSEADRSEAILHSARGQRDEVLAALARIDEKTYGQCADCGHEIPAGRLDARPDAARCVACQAKWAKKRR
jgi:DnaK suppressor protein